MAGISPFDTRTNAGFRNAPISKTLLGSLTISHVFIHIPMFSSWQRVLRCEFPESVVRGELWRIFVSKITFADTKDAIFAALLIYRFRVFERRYGSRKFASQLFGSFILSLLFECFFTYVLRWSRFFDFGGDGSYELSIGPLGFVFPWFVPYYYEIPQLPYGSFGGFSVSPKAVTYLFGLQLMGSSIQNAIACSAGLMAGLIYHYDILGIKRRYIPSFICNFFHRTLGWLIESSGSSDDEDFTTPMGATIEIQRAQQMEFIEQQRLRAQTRQQNVFRNVRQVGQGFAERLVDDDLGGGAGRGGGGGGFGGWSPFQNVRREVSPPSPENIQTLMDMGFSRQRSVEALRQTNNDLQSASTYLLQYDLQ